MGFSSIYFRRDLQGPLSIYVFIVPLFDNRMFVILVIFLDRHFLPVHFVFYTSSSSIDWKRGIISTCLLFHYHEMLLMIWSKYR